MTLIRYLTQGFRPSICVCAFPLVVALGYTRLSAQTVEDRINSILGQMTTEEKIKQLHAEGGFNTADNTRLGIPGFIMADGPHGVRDGSATSFPVGIGMASTWDVELARRIGKAMGEEFRGKGKHQALGPCLDIDRDPRNGRSPETGGEDPYLCAQITSAVVQGIQSTPCIATIKHFTANHRENGRTTNNIIASPRILNEDAGLAFRTAVQQGGAFSVMNAYNLINGEKCAENPNLLTTILRSRWGFPFYVVSDWGSIWSTEKAVKAGCDVCMGSNNYQSELPSLVASGAVSRSVLDEAVRRVLRTKILAGMMDYQPSGDPNDVNSQAHKDLCLEAGRKSLVLLKNQDNVLPLSLIAVPKIALIGPSANILQIDGSGSAYVTPFYTVTPKQGLEDKIGAPNVQFVRGCDINSGDTSGFSAARSCAKGADVVIFCGGLDPTQEGEGFDRVGGSIELPGKQQDLINALASTNKTLIVVLFSGGVCSISRSIENIKGLIYAFYPGQEAGRALADVLFGDYNPGGKLPVTIAKNDGQLPPWNDDLNDDFGAGYRWFDKKGYVPQFPFGYGLSYTTFSYKNLSVNPVTVNPGEPIVVGVDVTNTGPRFGEEVVQLYLTDVASTMPMPTKQLKAFKRVGLSPGETSRVLFSLTADELYYFDESNSTYEIEAGDFVVRVGGSSDNLLSTGTVTVTNGPRKADLVVTNVRSVPPYPLPGQKVVFLAAVKNQGSAAVTTGTPLKILFKVNSEFVSSSNESSVSIPAGGMALFCANDGPGGLNTWTADAVGQYTVEAIVDPDNAVNECVEDNNAMAKQFSVYAQPLPNLALRKAVSVTSVQGVGLEGQNAVDGNMGTRWSSAFVDPQALVVDLGVPYYISDVTLNWEYAFAKEYYIRISDGIGSWTDVYHETNGDGGLDKITVNANARKIMMFGVQRATQFGYSLYEVEVHGSTATGLLETADQKDLLDSFALDVSYPNPFNPTTTFEFSVEETGRAQVKVYDLLGHEVASLYDGLLGSGIKKRLVFDASGLSSGVYIVRLESGGKIRARRMVYMK